MGFKLDSDETGPPAPLTFLTIAQNEEGNIERCLRSTGGLGAEHLVVDGGSTDGTVALAVASGARVLERPFRYTADQYNLGLSEVETPWVFVLDADETLDAELRTCLSSLDYSSAPHTAYRCRRRNRFVNKWVDHGAWYPDFNLRLLRIGAAHYEDRAVHARVVTSGSVGTLTGHILHQTYRSVSHYVEKLNAYTDLEVLARAPENNAPARDEERKALLRSIWLRTPFRALTRFITDYILRLGFLDGRVGLDIAVSAAYYEYLVGMKRRYAVGDSPTSRVSDKQGSA